MSAEPAVAVPEVIRPHVPTRAERLEVALALALDAWEAALSELGVERKLAEGRKVAQLRAML